LRLTADILLERPKIKDIKVNKVIVVKLGGATLGNHDTAIEDIVHLQKQGKLVVIVHGGGKVITEWLEKHGAGTSFVHGERVTDKEALNVVTAVLCGLVNKEIVAQINSLGGQAVGLSGVDGALIEGKIKDKELGYVGEVVRVNIQPLTALLDKGYIPVVAPVSLYAVGKPSGEPSVLNINADAVAGEVAKAIGAERLIFLTDVSGISDESGKMIGHLSPAEAEDLISSGVASGGMIPKIKACLNALSTTKVASIIDGSKPRALVKEIESHGGGTTIGELK
jgi:acetylglutamate kinase